MSWGLGEFLERYLPIAVGIGLGMAAKYSLALNSGAPFSWRKLAADFLLIGIVALMARGVVDVFHLNGDRAVLCAAVFALAADRLVARLRERFPDWFEGVIDRHVGTGKPQEPEE